MNLKKLSITLASKLGIFFSKQPKKYDQLKIELRHNLLKQQYGVLHIGAHYGQESAEYSSYKLKVIWIEAAEEPYKRLKNKIKQNKDQKAIKALLGDRNSKTIFYTASNDASSSIYKIGKDMPHEHLKMIGMQEMQMNRLDTLFSKEELKDYKYWVIDVQGAEYLVLLGAGNLLKIPNVIEIEVSTREEYEDGSQFDDIDKLLRKFNFHSLWNPEESSHENLIYIKLAS